MYNAEACQCKMEADHGNSISIRLKHKCHDNAYNVR